MKRTCLFRIVAMALLLVGAGSLARAQEAEAEPQSEQSDAKVDFATAIKPILEGSCLQCHGPKISESELRLDTRESALKGGISENAIVPGKADESLVLERISLPADDAERMPEEGDLLTAEQIEAIKNWINQGADWPEGVTLELPKEPEAVTGFLAGPGLEINEAEQAVVSRVEEQGALAMRIAQNTNWLRIDYSIGAKEVGDADLGGLSEAQNLVELDLGGTKVTDAGLVNLAGLTNLVRLHLEQTAVTGAGLAHLKDLQHLEYLNLYATQVDDAALEHLSGLKGLKRLYLWQTKVTDEAVATLTEALPELYVNRGIEQQPETAEEKPAEEAAAEEPEPEKKEGEKEKKD